VPRDSGFGRTCVDDMKSYWIVAQSWLNVDGFAREWWLAICF
jgi:hypothetical protein